MAETKKPNEKRLICLDTACDMLNRFFHNAPEHAEKSAILEVKQALLEMGRVDAVEVVRCKDCKNDGQCSVQDAMNWTPRTEITDYFCSYGERREGENGKSKIG